MDVVTWFQHSGTLTLLTFLRVRRKYMCPRINITFISTLRGVHRGGGGMPPQDDFGGGDAPPKTFSVIRV